MTVETFSTAVVSLDTLRGDAGKLLIMWKHLVIKGICTSKTHSRTIEPHMFAIILVYIKHAQSDEKIALTVPALALLEDFASCAIASKRVFNFTLIKV